jgi:outer membrane protein assembly factor BamB
MKLRTALVLSVVLAALAATAGVALLGGESGELRVAWTSDTSVERAGNHHAVATGEGLVFAPVSGRVNSTDCALVALQADAGGRAWTHPVAPEHCAAHALADPTLADVTGDGDGEVVVATTAREVRALDPASGDVEWRANLSAYGYTKPVVADLAPAPGVEVVVADANGTVHVFAGNETAWTRDLPGMVWAEPVLGDGDGDRDAELVVAHDSGVVALSGDGTVEWEAATDLDGSITWATAGHADDDPAREFVVATGGGAVVALDGADGAVEWNRSFGSFAAVRALGDGDGDGAAEVYAVAADGILRALDASDGSTEWTTQLTTERVQMTPPPVLGDLDGDGSPELVAVTNDGLVRVLDPASGAVLATYERDEDVAMFTHATVADGSIYVIYGDGQVVALSYRPPG